MADTVGVKKHRKDSWLANEATVANLAKKSKKKKKKKSSTKQSKPESQATEAIEATEATEATEKTKATEAPSGASTRKARTTMVPGVGAVEVFDDDYDASAGQLRQDSELEGDSSTFSLHQHVIPKAARSSVSIGFPSHIKG